MDCNEVQVTQGYIVRPYKNETATTKEETVAVYFPVMSFFHCQKQHGSGILEHIFVSTCKCFFGAD